MPDTPTAYRRLKLKLVFFIAKTSFTTAFCALENERLRVNKIKHLFLYIGEPISGLTRAASNGHPGTSYTKGVA